MSSADSPWGMSPPASAYRASTFGPNGKPTPCPKLAPIGTRLMTSTPAAITMSCTPAMTAWAAKAAACCDEPHCRSMVVAGTDSGNPAASVALRPMLRPWAPTCDTHPMITSSTRAGSRSLRATSVESTSPARSAGCHPDSEPLRLPPGVRTTSTM